MTEEEFMSGYDTLMTGWVDTEEQTARGRKDGGCIYTTIEAPVGARVLFDRKSFWVRSVDKHEDSPIVKLWVEEHQ